MSDFYVGQKVVCIDANPHAEWPVNANCTGDMNGLTENAVYSIREVTLCRDGCAGLRLHSIVRGNSDGDTPFQAARFRPVEYKAVSVFRKIGQDVTDGKYVEIKEDA